jgi:hypothetical protein
VTNVFVTSFYIISNKLTECDNGHEIILSCVMSSDHLTAMLIGENLEGYVAWGLSSGGHSITFAVESGCG